MGVGCQRLGDTVKVAMWLGAVALGLALSSLNVGAVYAQDQLKTEVHNLLYRVVQDTSRAPSACPTAREKRGTLAEIRATMAKLPASGYEGERAALATALDSVRQWPTCRRQRHKQPARTQTARAQPTDQRVVRDDPFNVDLGAVFDLAMLREQQRRREPSVSDLIVYLGPTLGAASADTERQCTRSASAGALDVCSGGSIFAPNTSFSAGVIVGVSAPPVRIGPVPIRFGVEYGAHFPTGTATSSGTPVINLPVVPTGDSYNIREKSIQTVSGTISFGLTSSIGGYVQLGHAWVDKEITYNCSAAVNGFCGIAPAAAPFTQTQSVDLNGIAFGGGVQGALPRISGLPPMMWRVGHTHIHTGKKSVSFGTDATRSVQYNVGQDLGLTQAAIIVPIGVPVGP